MAAIELNLMRTRIVNMIYNESNVQALSEVEKLLVEKHISFDNAPCRYSPGELKQRVRRATASIREGKGFTIEEMKSFHPDTV